MAFRLYIELRAKAARDRGSPDRDAEFLLNLANHPYFEPETIAPRHVMEQVRQLAQFFTWDKPEEHPEARCNRVMHGYQAWCDAARQRRKLERWARIDARERAQAKSRELRDQERKLRIEWRWQRLKEKQVELERRQAKGRDAPESADRWAERQEQLANKIVETVAERTQGEENQKMPSPFDFPC